MERLNQNIAFCIALAAAIFWAIINQNSDILFGVIIGSSFFQILAMSGINKLHHPDEEIKQKSFIAWLKEAFISKDRTEENQIKYRTNGQYLIFCAILLLFLSGDYLLKGRYVRNELDRIDGGILIILFITYLLLMRNEEEMGSIQKWILLFVKGKDRKEDSGNSIEQTKKERFTFHKVILYFIFGIILFVTQFLVLKYISAMAVGIGISQYTAGLTLAAWCVNLSTILFISVYRILAYYMENDLKHSDTQEKIEETAFFGSFKEMDLEAAMKNSIIFITLFLGVVLLFRTIFINLFMIYHLIFFGIVVLLLQFVKRMDNRIAGSGMLAVYIIFIIYNLLIY